MAFEPLSYDEDDPNTAFSDYSDVDADEGMGSDSENLDPNDQQTCQMMAVELRPPTPTTPDYSLESYFPPAGTTIQQQRDMALRALQNMDESALVMPQEQSNATRTFYKRQKVNSAMALVQNSGAAAPTVW